MGTSAVKLMLPMQQGDVSETYADASLLQALTGFLPTTGVEQGVQAFVDWYREWTKVAGK